MGSWWPREQFFFADDGFTATDPSYEYQATLTSIDREALTTLAIAAFNGLAEVYGQEPFTLDEILQMAK